MKPIRYCLLFLTASLFSSFSCAQTADRVKIDIHSGYQQDNLRWSIAGNIQGQNPNVYSELKWRKLGGMVLGGNIGIEIWNGFGITGGYSRTQVKTGKVNDTDYQGENRTNPVYNQNFDDNKGYTDSWNGGLSYLLLNNKSFTLQPEIGYAQSRQSLYLLDLSGQFANLNSTYATTWKGPYIKLNAAYHLTRELSIKADAAYNQVNYDAKADWNLIQQFNHPVSYTHHAKGFGADANASLSYQLTDYLSINLGGGYFNWQTGNGTDQLFLTSAETDVTQMNGVFRHGYRLIGGLSLNF